MKLTKDQYTAKMRRRKPEPKKVHVPKGHEQIGRESNAVLLAKLDDRTARALRIIFALQHTCEVLDHALVLACAPRTLMAQPETPEHYCALAEKAIEEKNDAAS